MNTKLFLASVLFVGLIASSAQAARSIFIPTGTGNSGLSYSTSIGWDIQTGGGSFAGGGGISGVPDGAVDSLQYTSIPEINIYNININDNFTLFLGAAAATNACLIVGNTSGGNTVSAHANYTINIADEKTLTLSPTITNAVSIELRGGAGLTINGNVAIIRASGGNCSTQIVNNGEKNIIFTGTLNVDTNNSNATFQNLSSGNTSVAVLTGGGYIGIGVAGLTSIGGATILHNTTAYTGTIQFQPYGNLVLATQQAANVTIVAPGTASSGNSTTAPTMFQLGNNVNYSRAVDLRNSGSGTTYTKTLGAWGDGATALTPTTAIFSGAIAVSSGGSGSVILNLNAPLYTTLNINGNINGGPNTRGMTITGAGKVVISSTVAANIFSGSTTLTIANNSTLGLAGAASLLAPSMTFDIANATPALLDVSAATAFAWSGALNLNLINITWGDSVDKEWQLFLGLGGAKILSLSALTATDMGLTFTQNGSQWIGLDYNSRAWTFDQSNGKLYLGNIIPEPASLVLVGLGVGMIALLRRKFE